jgi:tetratricopeptide (TPR) repeat protein
MFKQLVAEKPDNPELLYDAGVAAFNNEDYEQAKAYFESAVADDTSAKQLKAQAYFNKGNAHVKLQELKEALLSYEQALMVQPDDERAKHNHQV